MSPRKQLLIGGLALLAAGVYCVYVSHPSGGGHGGYYDSRGHWIVPVPPDLQRELEGGDSTSVGRGHREGPNPLPAARIDTAEALAAYVAKHAPDRLREGLRRLARPCIRARTRKVEMASVAPGASRIGGLPDLPKGVRWPERRGSPMAFIAQIDLVATAALDPEGLLPKSGTLYFFYDASNQPWGFRPSDRDGWSVLHHVGSASELVRRPFPEGLDSKSRFFPALPSLALGASFPEEDTFYIKRLGPNPTESGRLGDLLERISETFPGGGHQVLGYAQQVQSAMEEECELASNGVDCGGDHAADPRSTALRAGASKWLLLLQIDSDENCGMMWGDAGRLYVWILREDLAKQDFSHVWVVLQCG